MTIVKMSDFELLVLNEQVDQLLEAFQRYQNISFDDLKDKQDEVFHPYQSDYDFERNHFIQERLQSILQSVDVFEKKFSKKKKKALLEKLNVKDITFSELNERCANIDIEGLLAKYDQYYDVARKVVEGYTCHHPWKKKAMTESELLSLNQQKTMIGTVDKKVKKDVLRELKKCEDVFFLYREEGDKVIFILVPSADCQSTVEIILDKYHFEKRSANSLRIEQVVSQMRQQLENMIEKQKTIDHRLLTIGHYREELQLYYEYLQNEELRYQTKHKFLTSGQVTKIAGWIFTRQTEEFTQLLTENLGDHYVLAVKSTPINSKEVPIKLENNALNRPFEGITNMYSLPRYNELDPTPLFTPFYAIFFGMMLGDVGYGLLMGILGGLTLAFVNLKESTANFVRFITYLSVPTVIWGWIYSSCFGGLVPIQGLIDINKDFMFVLVFAICFGILHLFIGLGIKAYMYIREGQWLYALFDVGFWYMTLIGAIILVSQMFTDLLVPYTTVGWWLLILGMIGILLTNGREAKTPIGKLASGFYSLYGLSNYIGDVLSYSRLMALGLAGASIGVAFNMITEMLAGFGAIGVVAGMIIFLIGHTFNLGISGLSAYVHSARLTYVEFFGKFYEGGGRKFIPFRSPNTYVNIKEEDE